MSAVLAMLGILGRWSRNGLQHGARRRTGYRTRRPKCAGRSQGSAEEDVISGVQSWLPCGAYRGAVDFLHVAEYPGDAGRLNYRMHNKLIVVANEIGIVGGRNVADEYFQGGRDFEFGDYDVITAGPIVNQVSNSFDAFWNSPMAIPIEALAEGKPSAGSGRLPRGARQPRENDRCRRAVHAHGRRRAARGNAERQVLARLGEGWRSSTTARRRPRSRMANRADACCASVSAKWRSRSRPS